jgi:hypothetical protein
MKYFVTCVLLLIIALCPAGSPAQTGADIKTSVDDLVGKHYFDGIPYQVAHALGPEALPYLFELLGDPGRKPFWVNIIVTMGFVEDPSAVARLIALLEDTQGEVDSFTFRALLSVPYALGCIAGGGDVKALQYLADSVKAPPNVRWSFQGKPVADLIVEQSVMGLGISGRPEAWRLLTDLKAKGEEKTAAEAGTRFPGNVAQALALMDRIATKGRPAVLNPKR